MEKMIIPLGEIKVEVTLEYKEGEMHSTTAIYNITEDLLNDFRHFKLQASQHAKAGDIFSMQRYQRAALLSIFGYTEAVFNRWCRAIKSDLGETEGAIVRFVAHESFETKVDFVRNFIASISHDMPPLDFRGVKKMRDWLAHFCGNDLDFVRRLDDALLEKFERDLHGWLSEASTVLNIPPHESSRDASEEFQKIYGGTLGIIAEERNSSESGQES